MDSAYQYTAVFTKAQLDTLLSLPEVVEARNKADNIVQGSIYFTITLSDTVKDTLISRLGFTCNLPNRIPMRWIKGDLPPHIDTNVTAQNERFDCTHLIYLTSSDGALYLDGTAFPITEGTAYIFSEGLSHETRGTSGSRLLMGPMNELAQPVGLAGIYGAGGTTIYLRENSGQHEYSYDQDIWSQLYWPSGVSNTDTSSGMLTIEFVTDMTLTGQWHYLLAQSSHIQFGSRNLKTNGSRPVIFVDGVIDYNGFIQNGGQYANGYEHIHIYNLEVRSINDSTLSSESGWITPAYFGKAAAHNYIVNCSSYGPISSYGGGICGSHVADDQGWVYILGCSSSGEIGNEGGGIVGSYVGGSAGLVECTECYSTGQIGTRAGGIIGSSSSNAHANRCYSTGSIGEYGGGIIGYGSMSAICEGSYSTGSILPYGGGIIGADSLSCGITNCYTIGNIQSNAGGICGDSPSSQMIIRCYTSGQTGGLQGYIVAGSISIPTLCYAEAYSQSFGWNTVNANTVLTGLPSSVVGSAWVATGINQPYETYRGYTPYVQQTITMRVGYIPSLTKSYVVVLPPGESTNAAIISDRSYTILEIANGNPSSYSSISINDVTGVISTTSDVVPGTYTIYVRNNGSYHITMVMLTIINNNSCCERPIAWASLADDRSRQDVRIGNLLIGSFNERRGPMSYDDLMRMKMAYAAKM